MTLLQAMFEDFLNWTRSHSTGVAAYGFISSLCGKVLLLTTNLELVKFLSDLNIAGSFIIILLTILLKGKEAHTKLFKKKKKDDTAEKDS